MIHLRELGQLAGGDRLDAGVLKADGVEHARGRVGYARRGVTEARLPRRALNGEGPEAVDVVYLRELVPVAEGAAGGYDGVVKLDAAQLDRRVHHTSSPLPKTGPSLQTRFGPFTVSTVQPMQAPKPQPMRASSENCAGAAASRSMICSIGTAPQA